MTAWQDHNISNRLFIEYHSQRWPSCHRRRLRRHARARLTGPKGPDGLTTIGCLEPAADFHLLLNHLLIY